jgi:hypothetical protein
MFLRTFGGRRPPTSVFAKFITECQKLRSSPVCGHCTGVFIGTRGAACPSQRRLGPRVPGLSPKYSHEGRLQIVIKVNLITDMALIALVLTGPITMGRITHAPPDGEGAGGP